MVVVSQYRIEVGADGRYHIHGEEDIACPVCGGILKILGTRKRTLFECGGKKLILKIRRLQCKVCNKVHHELPDIVIPYKRHCAETIEKIINGHTEAVGCENSTIRRIKAWWFGMGLYFENVLASLREKFGIVFSKRMAPREIVRAVANAHLWIHTRSAFLSG